MKDIQKKSDADLAKFIEEKREALREIRFKTAGSGMRDVKEIRNIKREVAQGLTERNARARKSMA
ncbi:50S ribosomal protein L29 [Candidatus Parcubacteria bacterium]|uniref:Large ribosomal subunit protein uL29 n=1 Tax=Candidatus Kaiserbacteria bacterium CG10_big_fil_rev_8_21_14_0_10_47_16 TaxID=1974608 RepID=A0A2H0UDN0_9BACT|nr:50S ribosomal protein L29 [Candidatus Parcubacteria bacterium]PIR84533.1 MAG: 50S ribosomal protein L29 [Candidatus Kaiserbacteria bacterium CG10_big_fil_rev_8_21_14_0_10_47_16]